MSIITSRLVPIQHFYRSGPMPCPYLPGQTERKLFTRIGGGGQGCALNATLTRAGFRRSHDILYRPVCPACAACVPVRVPVAAFIPSRGFRRVLRRNQDLHLTAAPATPTHEQFRLFSRYQDSRHGDSDMARMSPADYGTMVEEGSAETLLLEARDPKGNLLAVMLTDRLPDGYSAVYCFYDPEHDRRSLGTFMILSLFTLARHRETRLEMPPEMPPEALSEAFSEARSSDGAYVYLGYWIATSDKMAYKARFQPLEALGPEGWRRLNHTKYLP